MLLFLISTFNGSEFNYFVLVNSVNQSKALIYDCTAGEVLHGDVNFDSYSNDAIDRL